MISARKLAANHKNARRSTGPRNPAGKARAARNALRHGLAVPLSRTTDVSAEIDRLAMALAGRRRDPGALEQARIAAKAELELLRVRAYRKLVIDQKMAEAASENVSQETALPDISPELAALDRYERRALSRRKRAMRWLVYTSVLVAP